jgi:hypothetical protein
LKILEAIYGKKEKVSKGASKMALERAFFLGSLEPQKYLKQKKNYSMYRPFRADGKVVLLPWFFRKKGFFALILNHVCHLKDHFLLFKCIFFAIIVYLEEYCAYFFYFGH